MKKKKTPMSPFNPNLKAKIQKEKEVSDDTLRTSQDQKKKTDGVK
jgi:hypothetical protein